MPTDVLFLSYYFPPSGGAGVQRSAKFVRHLPSLGYRPLVVAGPGEGGSQWEPRDARLAEELPHDLVVHRPAAPTDALPRTSAPARWLGRSAPYWSWWAKALRETALRAAEDGDPRLVYVSLSPFEGLQPALDVGRELGVPVVADLRDPWALDEVQVYPSGWHRARAARRMGRLLARADRVVMNTPEALRALHTAFPELDPTRTTAITNGYDAADFAGLEPRARDGRLRIVHTGYLHTGLARRHARARVRRRLLGGELTAVDFFGRSHHYLLTALEALQSAHPEEAARIDLELLGVLSPADLERIHRSSFAPQVKTGGYRSHADAVRAMVRADVLFLPMHGLAEGLRARIVPGKTYEYLASGRPILAAVPDGDARDFVAQADAGRIVRPDDVEGITGALRAFLAEAPAPQRGVSKATLRFERRALTEQLAGVFADTLPTSAAPAARAAS